MKRKLLMKDLHRPDYFRRHCEILRYLLQLPDLENPAVKNHIRHAIREASNHASTGPGYDSKSSAQYMSVAAKEQMEKGDFSGLVGEHLVPVSELNRMLSLKPRQAWEKIAKILLKYAPRAVITGREHDLLKKLLKRMPPNWNRKNLLARYDKVGIELVPNRYKELKVRHRYKQGRAVTRRH